MVRAIFVFFISVSTIQGISLGETANSNQRSLDMWIAQWKNSWNRQDSHQILLSVIAVKKIESNFEVVPIPSSTLLSKTYLHTPTTDDMNLSLEINRRVGDKNFKSPCNTSIKYIALCFSADAVVDITEDNWKLYYTNGGVRNPVEIARASKVKVEDLGLWLASRLNHDGVILEVSGDLVLARILNRTNAKDIQALTLEQSENQLTFSSNSATGSALLMSLETKGNFGVFKIITGTENVKPGTKLLLEKGQTKN